MKIGDTIQMTADGGMFKKGENHTVNGISEDGKFFYYAGNLALSVSSDKYIIIDDRANISLVDIMRPLQLKANLEIWQAQREAEDKLRQAEFNIEMNKLNEEVNNKLIWGNTESKKYFIPDIEDIRVGYECRVINTYFLANEWLEEKALAPLKPLTREDVINRFKYSWNVAVPFLTKEQIIAEGWNISTNSFYELELKNEYATYFCNLLDSNKIRILEYTKTDPKELWSMQRRSIIFEGKCKDINTFRYVCKLLNI